MSTINTLHHLANISKFSRLLLTHQESVATRNLSTSMNKLERCPYSRGDPVVQPAALQESSTGPELSTAYKNNSHLYMQTTEFSFIQTWLESDFDQYYSQGEHVAEISPWLLFCYLSSPMHFKTDTAITTRCIYYNCHWSLSRVTGNKGQVVGWGAGGEKGETERKHTATVFKSLRMTHNVVGTDMYFSHTHIYSVSCYIFCDCC